MPQNERKRNILAYRTRIASLRLLSHKRSGLVVEAALRRSMHDARVRSAELDERVETLNRVRRDVWIVALTGMVSCIGATAATYQFVGRGVYTSFWPHLFSPMVTTTHGTLRVVGPAGLSLSQWLTAKAVETAVLGLPMSLTLRKVAGANALDLAYDWVTGLVAEKPAVLAPEQFRSLREDLVADGLGDPEFQRTMRDPNAHQEQVRAAMTQFLRDRLAHDVIEVLSGMEPPANLLLSMTSDQFHRWRRTFEDAASDEIKKTHPSVSAAKHAMLCDRVISDVWNDIRNQLNEYDRQWDSLMKQYHRAIDREILNLDVLTPR